MPSSVNLGKELEAFVEDAIANGRYGSRSEVLREGVRLVQDREAKLSRFDAEMDEAFESLRKDGGIPLDEAFAIVAGEIEAMAELKQAA